MPGESRWRNINDCHFATSTFRSCRLIGESRWFYLEIAPWNWVIPEISRGGEFRGVGSMLFWRAVKQSQEEGFHGCIGLHALPQAEPFYENACSMTALGRDPSKQNLL
jgi:hypothetical protein